MLKLPAELFSYCVSNYFNNVKVQVFGGWRQRDSDEFAISLFALEARPY